MTDSDDSSQAEKERDKEASEIFYSTLEKNTRSLALLPKNYPKYFGEDFEGYRIKYCGKRIKTHDFATLDPHQYLNDEIVNSYLKLITARSKSNSTLPKVYDFHSFFYNAYRKNGYEGVSSWINDSILEYDYLLIPIHEHFHWLMVIVDIRSKVIGAFDSLLNDNTNHLEHVRKFINTHALRIDDYGAQDAEWQIFNDKTAPVQKNGYDCGVYACQYAQYITKGKFLDFQQSQMNYFRIRMKYELLKNQLLND